MSHALSKHLLVDLYGCPADLLNDVTGLETVMIEAAQRAGATVINSMFHHFSPFGVSGVVVIQESHLTIHTWPEQGFAAIDLFTCGTQTKPRRALIHLKRALQSTRIEVRQFRRGQGDASPAKTGPSRNFGG